MNEGFNIEQASICMATDIFRVGKANPDSLLLIVCDKAKDADAADLTKYRVIPMSGEEVSGGIHFGESWRSQLKHSRCAKVAFIGTNNAITLHCEFYNSAFATQQWFQYGLYRGVCLLFEVRADVQKYDQNPPEFFS